MSSSTLGESLSDMETPEEEEGEDDLYETDESDEVFEDNERRACVEFGSSLCIRLSPDV